MSPGSRRSRAFKLSSNIFDTKEQGKENDAFIHPCGGLSRSLPLSDFISRSSNSFKKHSTSQQCKTAESGSPKIKLHLSSRTVKCHPSPAPRFACKSPGSLFRKNEAHQNELCIKSICLKKFMKDIDTRSDSVSPFRKFHQFQNYVNSNSHALKKHQRRKSCNASEYISCDTPDRNNICHLTNNGIKKKNNLGKGAYGTVMRGKYKGQDIAVKIISKTGYDSLRKETNAMHLAHPNIVQVLKVVKNDECGMVLMERNFGPNLQEVLCDAHTTLKPPDRVRYMLNVSEALEYCHSRGILHLDVKPKNILLCLSSNTCKLCDFGSSLTVQELQDHPIKCNIGVNTIRYTDPQLFLGELPSTKSDVYSLGITMWQMLSRKIPYDSENNHLIIYKVVSKGCRPEEVMDNADEDYKSLYKCCWRTAPTERPDSSVVSAKLKDFLQCLYLET